MEEHYINDYQIRASAYAKGATEQAPPYMARLNHVTSLGLEQPYWEDPASPVGSWLEVDLLGVHTVSSVTVQGDPNSFATVSTFKLMYSADVSTWTLYTDSSSNVVGCSNIHLQCSPHCCMKIYIHLGLFLLFL